MENGKRVVSLTAQNVLKLSAVHIEPGEGNVVLVGGKNGAGKTSVLNSILYAISGASSLPEVPVRRGAAAGRIELDLGDIIVERKFSETGTTSLVVKTRDGAKYPSPQKILDGLFSKLCFDPLKFTTMEPKEQGKILVELLGIDLSGLDKKRAELFDERTVQNRFAKAAEETFQRLKKFAEGVTAPETRPSQLAAVAELEAANEREDEKEAVVEKIAEVGRQLAEAEQRLAEVRKELEELNANRDEMKKAVADDVDREAKEMIARHEREVQELAIRQAKERDEFDEYGKNRIRDFEATLATRVEVCSEADRDRSAEIEAAKAQAEQLGATLKSFEGLPTPEEIREKMKSIEKQVEAFDQLAAVAKAEQEAKAEAEKADALTRQIAEIDRQKREQLSKVKYPIEGLGFSESGSVLFDGVPFSQASRAQQIRTSIAIGLALNPTLKVLLIKDGSLLDDDGLALVVQMADENGAQVWIERVGEKDESAIIIEDGHLKGEVVDVVNDSKLGKDPVEGEAAPGEAAPGEADPADVVQGEAAPEEAKPKRSFLSAGANGSFPHQKPEVAKIGGKKRKKREEAAGASEE